MSIYNDIRAALESHLANTAGLPTGIAYENVSFEPQALASLRCPLSQRLVDPLYEA